MDTSSDLPQGSGVASSHDLSDKGESSDFTQRIKPLRLVPVSAKKTVALQDRAIVSPIGQWRCPTCHKPFLLKNNTCYCPRYGITRSLISTKKNE